MEGQQSHALPGLHAALWPKLAVCSLTARQSHLGPREAGTGLRSQCPLRDGLHFPHSARLLEVSHCREGQPRKTLSHWGAGVDFGVSMVQTGRCGFGRGRARMARARSAVPARPGRRGSNAPPALQTAGVEGGAPPRGAPPLPAALARGRRSPGKAAMARGSRALPEVGILKS